MLNLFLAILLGNFDKARSFWLKKNIFEMFETAIEKKYSLSKAISIILGDVNKSVKEELLVHNEKDIFQLNGRLMIINRKLLENDPEEAEKLAYYDRLNTYEVNYKPILEIYSEEDREDNEENEEKMESGHFSREREKKSQKNDDLERIDEEEEDKEKEQEHLNESKEVLVNQEKNSKTLIINRPGEGITMKIHSPIEEEDKNQDAMVTNNFSMREDDGGMKFVTLETPREKVDELEEDPKEESKLLDSKKLKKSVTFDLRDPHVEVESPEQSFSHSEDDLPEEFKNENDEDKFKAANSILVSNTEKPLWKKVLSHMMNSSLFIFHKDWRCRRFLIDLIVSPESILEYENKKRDEAAFISVPDGKNGDLNKTFENQNTLRNQQSIRNQIDPDASFKRSKTGLQKRDTFYGNTTLAKTDGKDLVEVAKKKGCCQFNSHPSKYFDYAIILLILISSLLLIADNPLNDPNSQWSKVLGIIDIAFSLLFL